MTHRRALVGSLHRGFEAWGEILGDAMVAAALIERLIHYAHMVAHTIARLFGDVLSLCAKQGLVTRATAHRRGPPRVAARSQAPA